MNRETVYFTDFSKASPADMLSFQRTPDKWELVTYKTREREGTMIASLKGGNPPPATVDPGLTGWYAIYVAIAPYANWGAVDFHLNLRLSGEPVASVITPRLAGHNVFEEVFWRAADMTGQKLEISKFQDCTYQDLMLGWFKFVPLTEEQVAAYKKATTDKSTRTLYATHDMHGETCVYSSSDPKEWAHIAEDYRDSDVGYLSIENIFYFDGPTDNGTAPDKYPFFRPGDRRFQERFHYYNDDAINAIIQRGHEIGIEMIMSMRMLSWLGEFPFDKFYFDNVFYRQHPELHMKNRDGEDLCHLSYVYDEVQKYILDQFSRMAAFDVDGVEMLFNRGAPFLLFEPPFVEAFKQKYGVDPCELPLEDERMVRERCEIMTGFVKKLRARLDKERAERGQKRIKIIARGMLNIDDWKVMGLDVERWCEEHLVDGVLSYQLQLRENLSYDVWRDDDPTRIDLKKYTHAVWNTDTSLTERIGDFRFCANTETDYAARFFIPLEERVRQWQDLEDRTGVPVWHDIMPRQLDPEEYKQRAGELYAAGAKRFSLWDSYGRAPVKARWAYARWLGHKDFVEGPLPEQDTMFSYHRILKIGGLTVAVYPPSWS